MSSTCYLDESFVLLVNFDKLNELNNSIDFEEF